MPVKLSDIRPLLTDELLSRMEGDVTAHRAMSVISHLSDWFQVSDLPFFRYYTDHSAEHSKEVFATAIDLMSPKGKQAIGASDLCYLLMTAFVHDAGMHITENQFLQLVHAKNTAVLCSLDRDTWPHLWLTFLRNAKRFDPDRLIAIFGDERPVEDIPSSTSDFTDRHRMLIGEFLRQHHPRLAHDLMLGLNTYLGLPQLFADLDDWERDIVGLIARSHGCDIRSLFPYIKTHYDLREYRKVHIVYLMCLLRVADYAQLQSERAPRLKNKIHSIQSPVSQREWRVHQSIHNITRTHDDPEALVIDARPGGIGDFLRVRDWLVDLQAEIDMCWAVLGEVYGRQIDQNLDKLGLSIRRVRSAVIDNPTHNNFVPEKIGFRVAEAEMLALLLSPLYGDHGGYGLRELYQNASDAVRERDAVARKQGTEYRGRIQIIFDVKGEAATLSIRDNGIGMSLDVLKNYFLNAGASFRSSGEWKTTHLQDDGHSTVRRSGRFGVGALAGFIVGETMAVTTKTHGHPDDPGYQFTCSISDQFIEVQKVESPAGTSIKIACDKNQIINIRDTLLRFSELFDIGDDIDVLIKIDIDGRKVEVAVPPHFSGRPKYNFSTSKFKKVSVHTVKSQKLQMDFVNGIAVTPYDDDSYYRKIGSLYQRQNPFNLPPYIGRYGIYYAGELYSMDGISLAVEDYDAYAPLNLSRNYFNNHDPEVSTIINKLAFGEFCDFLEKERANLSRSDAYLPGKQSSIYRVKRTFFRFNNRRISPLDCELMRKQKSAIFVNLPRNINDALSYSEALADIDFIFCAENALSPSALIEHARRHRRLIQAGSLRYSCLVVNEPVVTCH